MGYLEDLLNALGIGSPKPAPPQTPNPAVAQQVQGLAPNLFPTASTPDTPDLNVSLPNVPDQYTPPQPAVGATGATGDVNNPPPVPQPGFRQPSRGAMDMFIENLPRLALGAVAGLAPRPIPYKGAGGFIGLGALRGLQGAARVGMDILDPAEQAKIAAANAATERAKAEAEYARAHAKTAGLMNVPPEHSIFDINAGKTIYTAPGKPDPRLEAKRENDANYLRMLKAAQDIKKVYPDTEMGDIYAHLVDRAEYATIPATAEYPAIGRAHEARSAGTAEERQARTIAQQNSMFEQRSAQQNAMFERRSAESERRFQQQQAHLEQNLTDPVVKPNEAPLWVTPSGDSIGRDIIGKRISQIPFGAVPLKDAADLRALGMAKRLVYVNDKLDALAPQILKEYGGDGIKQVWDVQANRLMLVPVRKGGSPKLKEFEAYLNDSLITLPQAMGIPGSRESIALLKRMESGTGSLGDTVQSMRAVNAANLGTVTAPLVARGIDILSDRKTAAALPAEPTGKPGAKPSPSAPPGTRPKKMIYDKAGNLVETQ